MHTHFIEVQYKVFWLYCILLLMRFAYEVSLYYTAGEQVFRAQIGTVSILCHDQHELDPTIHTQPLLICGSETDLNSD